MAQYGFFFDQSRCNGCFNCQLACKSKNGIPPGPVRPARLFEWEKGAFPNVRLHFLFAPCYHCENPVCVDAAAGALIKEEKYGAVIIDPAKATTANLKAAWQACPYGAISFDSTTPDAKAYMCNMCVDRLEMGKQPACVMVCMQRALDFGLLSDLQTKYGSTNRDLEDVPSSATTKPAVVFKVHSPKKSLVPYDSAKAIQLLGTRGSLPSFYTTSDAVTVVPDNTVGRGKLNMKVLGADLIKATQCDDG